MNITLDTLRKLINEEIQRRDLQEAKRNETESAVDLDDDKKISITKALDVLEDAAEEAADSDEARWYLTKIGETFGLEPEEIE